MATFVARVSAKGTIEELEVIAKDMREARGIARRSGKLVSIKQRTRWKNISNKSLTPDMRVHFLQKLGLMVRSKVPLTDALSKIEASFSGPVKRVAGQLKNTIKTGTPFQNALEELPNDFPDTCRALINAGMKSGEFYTALEDAYKFELEMMEVKKNASMGLVYAIFNFMFGALLILGTCYVFAPWFLDLPFMKASDEVDIDWAIQLGDVMGVIIALITAFVMGLGALQWVIKPMYPGAADRLILKLPVYRELALSRDHFIVFYTLSRLIDSRIRMEEAMWLAYCGSPKGEVKEDLGRAHASIKQGKRMWASAMKHITEVDRASLMTSQDVNDVVLAVRAVAQGKKEDYANTMRSVVPKLSLLGYLMMALAGFMLFVFSTIPVIQIMNGLL